MDITKKHVSFTKCKIKTLQKWHTKWLLPALIMFLALGTAGCGNNNNGSDNDINTDTGSSQMETDGQGLKEGDTAPDFTADLPDGKSFSLSKQKGKIVLLNFWATWCEPCVREMPAFERLHKEYGDEIAILAINSMEDAKTVDQFIEEEGYTFPIAYDTEGTIGQKYPTDGIPYTLIIGADSTIHYIYAGAADADTQYQEYKKAIEAVKKADTDNTSK